MQELEGIHFYINIKNFDEVILDELERTKGIKHAIHALDTYFSRIEAFGKKYFPGKFVVEKITGGRLHMYTLGNIEETYDIVLRVVGFAKKLADYFKTYAMPKYNTLLTFQVQAGAEYGRFYDFEFKTPDTSEETTIGGVANYAAKLQECCRDGELAISCSILRKLPPQEQEKYCKYSYTAKNIYKYSILALIVPYKIPMDSIANRYNYTRELEASREYANKVSFTDMNLRDAQQKLIFDNLSKTECKRLRGISFFADIRNSTGQLSSENLMRIAEKYQRTLGTMYRLVKINNGVHVQFQGDREFALFQDFGDHKCCIDALKTGAQLIDALQNKDISVGIGLSLGEMYAAKIGARGEKDFLLMGKTVIDADENEDGYAGKNQIVISDEIYKILGKIYPKWANDFESVERAEKNYEEGYYYKIIV